MSVYKHHIGYWPDKGTCLSCTRCIDFCPVLPGPLVDGQPVINKEMLNLPGKWSKTMNKLIKNFFTDHRESTPLTNAYGYVFPDFRYIFFIICILLIANYIQTKKVDPVNITVINSLVERLSENPSDTKLRDESGCLISLHVKHISPTAGRLKRGIPPAIGCYFVYHFPPGYKSFKEKGSWAYRRYQREQRSHRKECPQMDCCEWRSFPYTGAGSGLVLSKRNSNTYEKQQGFQCY